jgi:hypothetical protein
VEYLVAVSAHLVDLVEFGIDGSEGQQVHSCGSGPAGGSSGQP